MNEYINMEGLQRTKVKVRGYMVNADWIVSIQHPEVLKKYTGPVVWINRCERCGEEEPVYAGPVDNAVNQGHKFIQRHKYCK
jgi:hypothetical protein